MEIRSLADVGPDAIYEAFNSAFSEYEVQINREELERMFLRRGFDPELSFAAFDRGRIVSMTCNGIGEFDSVSTAYDTGTGTLAAYREQRLAARVFEYSIPRLQEAGIARYFLEVLQHNTPAVSVYRRMGFEISREFEYFRTKMAAIRPGTSSPCDIRTVDPEDVIPAAQDFWDFRPSWQNSFESIRRAPDHFICVGAYDGGRLAGYAIFEPAAGDVTQIAVDKDMRRRGIGSALFQTILDRNLHDSVKILNTEIGPPAIAAFLRAKGIEPTGRQFEMIKQF